MNRDIANICAGVALFAGSAGLYFYTASADYRMGAGVAYDAGLMPKLWLAIAAISAVGIIIKGIAGRIYDINAHRPLSLVSGKNLAVAFVQTALFLVAFSWLGFWASILLFIPVFSVSFGYRKLPWVAASTLVFATVTWLVFAWLLEVQITAFPEFLRVEGRSHER